LWRNVTSPVIKNNSRKFLNEADMRDVGIFESVAGSILDALGYVRAVVRPGAEEVFSKEKILAFDEENQRKKEESRKLVDPADLIRRDLQSGLLKTVKERTAQKEAAAKALPRLAPITARS